MNIITLFFSPRIVLYKPSTNLENEGGPLHDNQLHVRTNVFEQYYVYLLSFVETPRKFIIQIINLRGVSTKLNKYIVFTMQTYKKLNIMRVLPLHIFISMTYVAFYLYQNQQSETKLDIVLNWFDHEWNGNGESSLNQENFHSRN